MKRILTAFFWAGLLPAAACAQAGRVHEAMEQKYGAPGLEKLNAWMEGQVLRVEMEEEYVFPLAVTMHITTIRKNGKKEETDMPYYFHPGKSYLATEGDRKKQEMLIIYDHARHAVLMLNRKDKTGMAINMNAFMSGEAIRRREERIDSAAVARDIDCRKTGRKKEIQGYPCVEYVCTDKEKNTRNEIWITDRIDADIAGIRSARAASPVFLGMPQQKGMLMAGYFYRNETLESSVEVTSVNEKADLHLRTADYTFSGR